MTSRKSRERKWLLMVEDGRHVWQGRSRDPSPEDLAALERSMRVQRLRGWIAVSEGRYYSEDTMTLLPVSPMNGPADDWPVVEERFHERRAIASSEP